MIRRVTSGGGICSPGRRRFATIGGMKTTRRLLLTFTSVCLATTALAVDPPPDGGYDRNTTAEGDSALLNLDLGFQNTAVGYQALLSTTIGGYNTGIGARALESNATGSNNTAVGSQALLSTTGESNTAVGSYALEGNTTGKNNTAIGAFALLNSSIGYNNTANGVSALALNTTGRYNTAIGIDALVGNTTGDGNIAIGNNAGANLTTGSNNIEIGSKGMGGENNTIRLGTSGTQKKTFIAGITGVTVVDGVSVVVNSNGQLGVVTSSARYKEKIEPMKDASAAILSLRPVTFRYKKELDPEGTRQCGLVAEEVAKVDPDLVANDDSGKPYTVRYEAVNAMLLNEFRKEHRKMESQAAELQVTKSQVESQSKEIAELKAALKEQAAQIQKVSARLETNAVVRRVVEN